MSKTLERGESAQVLDSQSSYQPPDGAGTIKVYRNPRTLRPYFLPFHLPPGKSGKWSVQITKKNQGEKLSVVTMRGHIFMGLRASNLILSEDTYVHWLKQDGGVWMSTMPVEVEQHVRQLERCSGRVLVGGIGLGLAVSLLEQNPAVTSIVACEISKDVINLVRPYLPQSKTIIVRQDLYKFLWECHVGNQKFDHAFYDIWCSTGQTILREHVIPLRRASLGIIPQRNIECWQEKEMIGQVRMSLETWIMNPFGDNRKHAEAYCEFNKESAPFIRWVMRTKPRRALVNKMLTVYLKDLLDPAGYDERWKVWEAK